MLKETVKYWEGVEALRYRHNNSYISKLVSLHHAHTLLVGTCTQLSNTATPNICHLPFAICSQCAFF